MQSKYYYLMLLFVLLSECQALKTNAGSERLHPEGQVDFVLSLLGSAKGLIAGIKVSRDRLQGQSVIIR
mgnify:CR=1 FL=1